VTGNAAGAAEACGGFCSQPARPTAKSINAATPLRQLKRDATLWFNGFVGSVALKDTSSAPSANIGAATYGSAKDHPSMRPHRAACKTGAVFWVFYTPGLWRKFFALGIAMLE
jgi:hypothetical protein